LSHPRARLVLERLVHNRWVTGLLSLAIIAGLVALALSALDLHGLGRALGRVRPGWLVAALALMGSSFLARAESWYVSVRAALPELRAGRGAVRRGLLIGMAGSAVAPGRLGEAIRAWVVARRAREPGAAFAVVLGTVLLQSLLNLLALVILTAIALAGAASVRASALGASAGGLAAAVALLAGAPRLLAALPEDRGGRPARASRWLLVLMVRLRRGLRVLRRPRAALHAGGFQLLAWALQLTTCWTVLQALRLQPHSPLSAAAAVLVAVNITAVVPLTPSNVGVFQAACIAALAPFGVGATSALAYGLLLQGVEIACDLALGLPSLLREGLSFGEVRRAAREGRRSMTA
jgi:phosphatidylinositol alpha-mannosyltransferase